MSWVYPSPTIEISRFRQKDPNSMGYHNRIILALLNRKGPRWRSNQLTFAYLTGASDQIPPKRIISVLQFWDSKKGLYTPLKINGWNLKIHQIEKENHLNQTSICVNLSGSTKLFTKASCHCILLGYWDPCNGLWNNPYISPGSIIHYIQRNSDKPWSLGPRPSWLLPWGHVC